MLLIREAEWVDAVLPEFLTLRSGIADAEMLLLTAVREICPFADADGELDVDARMIHLTASEHAQGDSVSGFVTGFERVSSMPLHNMMARTASCAVRACSGAAIR
jgi:hypothetical protein